MDNKVMNSRKAFVMALIDSLRNKELSEVTVKELCVRSGYSKSSFYGNFTDKLSVMAALEEELSSSIRSFLACEEIKSYDELVTAWVRAADHDSDAFIAVARADFLGLVSLNLGIIREIGVANSIQIVDVGGFLENIPCHIVFEWIIYGKTEPVDMIVRMITALTDIVKSPAATDGDDIL